MLIDLDEPVRVARNPRHERSVGGRQRDHTVKVTNRRIAQAQAGGIGRPPEQRVGVRIRLGQDRHLP